MTGFEWWTVHKFEVSIPKSGEVLFADVLKNIGTLLFGIGIVSLIANHSR